VKLTWLAIVPKQNKGMKIMRLLLLGAATVALSGCSWISGSSGHHGPMTNNQGYYSHSNNDVCCDDAKSLSRWNLEGAIGPEFIVGGDAITGDRINDPFPGAVVASDVTSMKDAFDPGMRYELGGSYALNPNRKLTLMGSYAKAEGEEVNLGTINGDALTGNITDYERYGVEAGLRQYFTPKRAPLVKALRPYVEGRLGAAKVKDVNIENAELGGAAYSGGTAPFYKGGWVPTAAGLVGVEAPVFKRATLGLETGLRYTGTLDTDTSVFGPGVPLAGTNNGSDSWTVPVMLRGRYRF
jgi:hypothetical protein